MVELLDKRHNRSAFDCGKEVLNNYLKYQARQDMKRKLSACFVLPANNQNLIRGYYTLSNNSIPLSSFPDGIRKKLPVSYVSIPTTLLGRLAIDKDHQGIGLGKVLLIDALKWSYELSASIGSYAVFVDPIDIDTEGFYEKHDFIRLPGSGKMFIPVTTLKLLFG